MGGNGIAVRLSANSLRCSFPGSAWERAPERVFMRVCLNLTAMGTSMILCFSIPFTSIYKWNIYELLSQQTMMFFLSTR